MPHYLKSQIYHNCWFYLKCIFDLQYEFHFSTYPDWLLEKELNFNLKYDLLKSWTVFWIIFEQLNSFAEKYLCKIPLKYTILSLSWRFHFNHISIGSLKFLALVSLQLGIKICIQNYIRIFHIYLLSCKFFVLAICLFKFKEN